MQSQLYEALDAAYITQTQFTQTYAQAAETRRTIHGFIRYLLNYQKTNQPPNSKTPNSEL